jgi:DNA polymerase-4
MNATTTPPTRHLLHLRYQDVLRDDARYPLLLEIAATVSARIQALPPDAAVLDLTGAVRYFDGTPQEVADMVRLRTQAMAGVGTAAGLGPSLMLAAIAAGTAEPGHLVVVPDDDHAIMRFLHPRPVAVLPGIGPATARTLAHYGLQSVGELARTPLATLQRILGASAGLQAHYRAHAYDPRPVTPKAPPRTITRTVRFGRDAMDADDHRRAVLAMAHDLGAQLRDSQTVARTVTLSVRFADRSSTSRSRTLPETTDHTRDLTTAADTVLGTFAMQRARVRAITMALDLGDPAAATHQLALDPTDDRQRSLEVATDRARRRFGPTAIGPALLYRAA